MHTLTGSSAVEFVTVEFAGLGGGGGGGVSFNCLMSRLMRLACNKETKDY